MIKSLLAGVGKALLKAAEVPAPVEPPSRGGTAVVPPPGWLVPLVRDRWLGAFSRQWTPDRVEVVLRGAIAGDHASQWELFDLMEDTWPRLAKNLLEIKRAVRAMAWRVEPWAEDDKAPTPEAEERAALASRSIWTMRPRPGEGDNGFGDTVFDLLDAWGKGTVVLETDWEVRNGNGPGLTGAYLAPRATRWVHPRFWGWGESGIGLRKAAATFENWWTERGGRGAVEPFPEHKYIVGIARARSGHPLGTALLRPLAWWWCASNFSAEWWLNYAQIFGIPIRWANYAAGAPDETITKVETMLSEMGSAAWAAFPEGTQLNILESTKGGTGANPQQALLDHADRLCDILVLGQTLTTDVGESGSRALGDVHQGVRSDVIQAAADWAAETLTEQLIRPIVLLNWGDDAAAPTLLAEPRKEEDQKANAERDAILLQHVEIPKGWFYERHGIPIPQAGEETVGGAAPAPDMDEGLLDPDDPEEPEEPTGAHARCSHGVVHARRSAQDKLTEAIMEDLAGVEARWLGGVRPFFQRLVALAMSNRVSDEDFLRAVEAAQRQLPELFNALDTQSLQDAMERAMGAAVVNGASRGYLRRGNGKAARRLKLPEKTA